MPGYTEKRIEVGFLLVHVARFPVEQKYRFLKNGVRKRFNWIRRFKIYDCACLALVGRMYVGTYVLCIRIHVYKNIYSILSYLYNSCVTITIITFYHELGRNVKIAFRPSFPLRPCACMNTNSRRKKIHRE